MKIQDLRIVHDKWLWQRAGALETKLLKKYGRSMARISIDNRFNKCIKCSYIDEPIMEIDYNEYRRICKEIESEYAVHPTEKGETERQIQTAKTMIEKMVSCYDQTEKGGEG